MTRPRLILLAAGGSAALLVAVFAMQYAGGLAPCELCLWQRWPHAAAIVIAAAALLIGPARFWAALGALAALTTAALGVYHTGVQRGWWPGPDTCTGGGDLSGLSGAQLLDPQSAGMVVMCDQVAWTFLGLSLASWNAVAALALALVWVAAALPRRA